MSIALKKEVAPTLGKNVFDLGLFYLKVLDFIYETEDKSIPVKALIPVAKDWFNPVPDKNRLITTDILDKSVMKLDKSCVDFIEKTEEEFQGNILEEAITAIDNRGELWISGMCNSAIIAELMYIKLTKYFDFAFSAPSPNTGNIDQIKGFVFIKHPIGDSNYKKYFNKYSKGNFKYFSPMESSRREQLKHWSLGYREVGVKGDLKDLQCDVMAGAYEQ
jgi:hypothetical protein